MPAIPPAALAPAGASPLSPLLTPLPMPFVDDLQVVSAMPAGGAPAAWRSADARETRIESRHRTARMPRSIYDHPLVKKTITHLLRELDAANARGDGPLTNKALLERLIEQAPDHGISPTSIRRFLDYRLPSLLLPGHGFALGTMKALYYNLGKLNLLSASPAPTQRYVAEGRAMLNSLISLQSPELLISEFSGRSKVAVMVHAKANNAPGLDDWDATDGYARHAVATNAVAADFANSLKGTPTVVEAQIEARRIAAGYDPFDQAFMWLMNVVQSVPSFVTAPFEAMRR